MLDLDFSQFEEATYCETEPLRIFVQSLSYHVVGARFFSKQISHLKPPPKWRLLDVGCGDGQFTTTLLDELRKIKLVPDRIEGVDPDRENLRYFEKRLSQFPDISLECKKGKVETLGNDRSFIIVASHSLYGFLENPQHTEEFKDEKLLFLARLAKDGGAVMISLASRTSPAYEYKRRVLQTYRGVDRSIFGEDVIDRMVRLKLSGRVAIRNSYMDVTDLLKGDDTTLLDWTRYFCRLTASQALCIRPARLRSIMAELASKFSSLPRLLARAYSLAPAATRPPTPDSLVLPHKECFIVIPAMRN